MWGDFCISRIFSNSLLGSGLHSLLSHVISFSKFEMWCPLKISPGSIGYCPKKSKNSKIFEFGVVNHISSKNFHPHPDPVKSMYFLHFLWKEPMLRWLSGVFPCVSGLIPLQGKSEYGWILVPGGQIGLFHLQELWRASWPQGPPDREKSFNLSPRDLGPSPLNAGQVWHLDLCVTLGV